VVSDISPLREIICPGRSGLVAERENPASFAHAIMSLFRDPEYLRRVGREAARHVAKEFPPSRMMEKTLQFYGEVAHRMAEAE
jgi:glycosyltransferase involved in cell wall biosynthesis